jgi:hypothetical protein
VADGGKRYVDLPLDASAGIPVGFAVTDDADAGKPAPEYTHAIAVYRSGALAGALFR